jgi:hypothetical protein
MRDMHVQMNNAPVQRIQYSEYNDRSENELHSIFILSISNRHKIKITGEVQDGLGIV